jgi:hypothetical protein
MPFSRRGFFATTGAALLAGCNEADQPTREETVTPVDVPLSSDAALAEAADIEVPAIPSAVIVSDEHQADLVARAEGLVETADEEATSADDVELSDVWGSLRNPENVLGRAREAVETLRETRSRREYRRAISRLEDVGTVLGYVRAETSELDVEAVRAALEREQAAFDALQDRFEYRFRAPVDRYLPTITAAESGIERTRNELSRAERGVEGLDSGPEPVTSQDIAGAWARIELVRLWRTNAVGFARTAVDPSRPLRRDAVTDVLGTQLDEVASQELLRDEDAGSVQVPQRIRSIVSTVRSRRSQLLRGADPGDPANPSTSKLLFNSLQVRAEIEAFGAAGELTFELLERETFPAKRLVSEKREAVQRLEALTGAAPLPRRLGRLAEDMVTFGDRLESASRGGNPVATAFFVYVAAREYVDLALDRAETLTSALEAPDDTGSSDNS